MKYCTLFIFLGLIIGCGNNTENGIQLKEIIKKVEKEHNVELSYKLFLTKEVNNPLVLTLKSDVSYRAELGNIILTCYQQIKANDLSYDRYVIQNTKGEIGIDLNPNEIRQIIACNETIDEFLNALLQKDVIKMRNYLDTEIFSASDIDSMMSNTDRLHGKINKIGFETQIVNNQNYCMYQYIIDTKLVGITTILNLDNCKIHAVQF